jgi:hypothetical protein
MNLIDGLKYFKECSDSDWQFTLQVESSAVEVLKLISQHGDQPNSATLSAAHTLLVDIEKWKAMCLQERMGNAAKNSPRQVWEAFRGAVDAKDDVQSILSIMRLKGFGSSLDEETGQRRAKVATAVLRFLKPKEWGVVDWRTIAMLGMLKNSKGNVDQALVLARKEKPSELRGALDLVDERGACEVNREYRAMRASAPLLRTVDVEMAIFGLSVMAWPFPVRGDQHGL